LSTPNALSMGGAARPDSVPRPLCASEAAMPTAMVEYPMLMRAPMADAHHALRGGGGGFGGE
jgi:hypothetical protein